MTDDAREPGPFRGDAGPGGDPYSRVEYRRLIAWKRRIEREGPFLLGLLDGGPDRSVLDVGCGTGEHTAFFAREGARAVGIDASESMIVAACEHEARGEGRFVLGDALDVAGAIERELRGEPPFGLAICLGNMLPHVTEDEDLATLLSSIAACLRPGGRLLVQLLSYERIRGLGLRALPVNMRPGEDGREIAFVRLMKDTGDGRVLFFPTTLELDPGSEEPVRVHATRRVALRAWTRDDLGPALEAAGFDPVWHGDMQGGPFDPLGSHDLVVVATRR